MRHSLKVQRDVEFPSFHSDNKDGEQFAAFKPVSMIRRLTEEESMQEPDKHSRRSFLDFLLGTGLAGWFLSVIYPIFRYLQVPAQAESAPSSVVAANLKQLQPNQGLVFRFGNRPAILIRKADGTFKAFSAVCTHLECTIQYRDDLQKMWCACHMGLFNLNGQNISGPPPRPLEEFKVAIKGEEVLVSKA